MTTTHTPGPWRVSGFYIAADEPTRDKRGSHRQVADWTCGLAGVSDASDLQKANARLIAAAPELLAALKRATQLMEDADLDDESPNDDGYILLQACRAAIAKAEGRP